MMGYSFGSGFWRSRRFSSASIASRMNAAMRRFPTSASIRRRTSSVRRTIVALVSMSTFSGGRPMRLGLSATSVVVKSASICAE